MRTRPRPGRLAPIVGLFLSLLFLSGCAVRPAVSPAAPTDYDVIVVGGGLAGLAAGVHLSVNGMKVLVCEQHDKVGGCATSFEREPFVFDASLHEMAGGGAGKKDRGLVQLLRLWGIDKKVDIYELPHFYRSVFPGVDVTLPPNWEGFTAELKRRWPEEAEGIEKFHRLCASTFSDLMELKDLFRQSGLRAMLTKALVPLRQPTFFKYKDKTLADVLDECFASEEIKAVVSQLWVYYGAPVPDQTALIALAATEVYLTDGVWHIRGTSQALSNAYAERIEELGGTVKTDTRVSKIRIRDNRATGIETEDGDAYTARYVVANTDPYQFAYKLTGAEHFPAAYLERLKTLKPANSLCGVYLGLNIDLKARGYRDTEIFYSPVMDSRILHDAMMRSDFQNGAVAITIYSNYGDPVYAPPGKSVVTLNAYSQINQWPEYGDAYDKKKEKMMDDLIALAGRVIPELTRPENIEHREGFTPRTIQRYTMNRGGIVYGFYLSPDQWQKIPHNTPFDNVFIASNWTQAWHGVGSAQVNGWRAARLILDREGLP